MWILFALLALVSAEAATPTYVAVDRGAWLHLAPTPEARRLRVTEIEEAAPAHTPTPVVLLQLLSRGPVFTEVRPVNMAPPLTESWQIRAPDVTPDDWPHCYPPPAALAQLSGRMWVRTGDLLPFLQRTVTARLDDGSEVRMEPGLVLSGGNKGRYRVRGNHLSVVANVPGDAVAETFQLIPGRAATTRMRLVRPDGTEEPAHPQLRMRLSAAGEDLELTSPAVDAAADGKVAGLVDRCLTVTFGTPLTDLPVDPEEDTLRWPIFAPQTSEIKLTDGTKIGIVGGGELPLWSRRTCSWNEETGMCCDPPAGLELASGDADDDFGICYLADPPDTDANSDVKAVITRQSKEHAAFVAAYATGERQITWTVDDIDGDITEDDLRKAIAEVEDDFDHCYTMGLQTNPKLTGALDVTLVLMMTGRVQYAKAIWEETQRQEKEKAGPCMERALSKISVLNQIGMPVATVGLRFEFTK